MMNCRNIDRLLSDYMDDPQALSESTRRGIEDHLASCAVCRGRAAEMKRLVFVMRDMGHRGMKAPAGFAKAVRYRLAVTPVFPPRLFLSFRSLYAAVPAGVLALAALIIAGYLFLPAFYQKTTSPSMVQKTVNEKKIAIVAGKHQPPRKVGKSQTDVSVVRKPSRRGLTGRDREDLSGVVETVALMMPRENRARGNAFDDRLKKKQINEEMLSDTAGVEKAEKKTSTARNTSLSKNPSSDLRAKDTARTLRAITEGRKREEAAVKGMTGRQKTSRALSPGKKSIPERAVNKKDAITDARIIKKSVRKISDLAAVNGGRVIAINDQTTKPASPHVLVVLPAANRLRFIKQLAEYGQIQLPAQSKKKPSYRRIKGLIRMRIDLK